MLKTSSLKREDVPEEALADYDKLIESEEMILALLEKKPPILDEKFARGMSFINIARHGFVSRMKYVHGIEVENWDSELS